ncbi:MAG TPA: ribonuclease III [Terriglobales bacterium]
MQRESKTLEQLENALDYEFNNKPLLRLALTHSSLAHELESRAGNNSDSHGNEPAQHFRDNEQLEFLGDAVLGFVTSRLLFERFPDFKEGQLSKLRAHLVSARYLIKVARQLQLGKFLLLGRGEERSGGRSKPALLVDALEAMIAAIFLDGGMDPARKFIIDLILKPELDRLGSDLERGLAISDYKSALQELLQSRGMGQPSYVLVDEAGPEHKKLFTLEVRINPQNGSGPLYVTRAEGTTKKKAEQKAAQQALDHLQREDDLHKEHETTLAESN